MLEDRLTIWRPNAPEVVSELPGIDLQSKGRRLGRRAWREGFADQTVVRSFEDLRSYRAFERALVDSVGSRSVLELALVHRLASLLWRLHRACAIKTGLFEMQGDLLSARRQDLSRGPSQPGVAGANGHSKGPGSNGRDDPPISDQNNSLSTTMRAAPGRWSRSPTLAAATGSDAAAVSETGRDFLLGCRVLKLRCGRRVTGYPNTAGDVSMRRVTIPPFRSPRDGLTAESAAAA
jgi:hypothetical protein